MYITIVFMAIFRNVKKDFIHKTQNNLFIAFIIQGGKNGRIVQNDVNLWF